MEVYMVGTSNKYGFFKLFVCLFVPGNQRRNGWTNFTAKAYFTVTNFYFNLKKTDYELQSSRGRSHRQQLVYDRSTHGL